ncbi:FidL-like protein [Providencia alcalifaciens]|uniref:FidL-like protein n=1 Tax=Providencia alcalifaciens TaxID=126385 RepID=UPI001CE23107|nr:FidL-like protein [Providencia alcalifaciens]UBX49974.1 FidL-like protein [Providencia alcalifaciens]
MKISGKLLCLVSALIFACVVIYTQSVVLTNKNSDQMACSTKGIMRFENMKDENVNGNIHFNFGGNGEGSIVVEGYTTSNAGWLYLQRYVKFKYTSKRISPTERHYNVSHWEASASSIDESPNVIFDYFIREMSDSHDGLFINVQKLNDKALLLSSINSPLFICTPK